MAANLSSSRPVAAKIPSPHRAASTSPLPCSKYHQRRRALQTRSTSFDNWNQDGPLLPAGFSDFSPLATGCLLFCGFRLLDEAPALLSRSPLSKLASSDSCRRTVSECAPEPAPSGNRAGSAATFRTATSVAPSIPF